MDCLEKMFVTENDNFSFTVSEVLQIYQSFDILSLYWNVGKINEKLMDLTLTSTKSNDDDFLALYKLLHKDGYLSHNNRLCVYLQEFLESKSETISTQVLLDLMLILHDQDLWQRNGKLMNLLTKHFNQCYFKYTLDEICILI